ncbi:MAG: hypothetical protein ACT4PZ_02820 [Panacagrimonas sp.]
MKKKPKAGPAEALLEAHVAFVLEQLAGDPLNTLLENLLDTALEEAAQITLESVVTLDMIKATARTYAVELELGGGIPELVGDIARALHAHPVHDRTRLSDLISQRRFEDLLDHALALKSVRSRLVGEVIASPLYESIASDLLYNGIRDYLTRGAGASISIPGARSAMKFGRAVIGRATSGLESALEENIKKHIGHSVGQVSEKTAQSLLDGEHDAALREVALDSWRHIRNARVGDLREDLSALDVEELFVTLYEWWKELRKTPFMGAMIDAGIERFFDRFGAQTLAELLDDLGISRSMMLDEALRFAPHVLQALNAAGRVEPVVRQLLAPFYRSGRVEAVLKRG